MKRTAIPIARWGALIVLLSARVAARGAPPTLDAFVTTGLADLRATVTTLKADPAELEKINRDFATLYRLRKLTLSIKAPDCFRFENEVGLYLVNGSARYYRVPVLRLKKREDLGNQPGKRPSLLDLGLITPDVLARIDARYVRSEPADGTPTDVFDVTLKHEESIRYRMWIDPKTRLILRREWRDGAGKLRAVFLCGDPKEVARGIWMPTRIEVRNADGAVAGVLSYSDLSVNVGLDPALFVIPP
jgi:outer membrane lipoprotein-sorting protein